MRQGKSALPIAPRVEAFGSGNAITALLTITLFGLAAALSLYLFKAPDPVPIDASPDVFSSGRAMRQLEMIAQRPHPIGSADHERVRAYIVQQLTALGVLPQIQQTTAVNPDLSLPYTAATVNNIIARVPGTANTKALLIVCHYDSVLAGPGANDDGVAVAALLETLRALKVGVPLKNDVIMLFTDGEEAGLLGAEAYVAENSLMQRVGVVLNFEARGGGGPSLMFETSPGNGWLIQEFARAAPSPFASSLFYEVYKYLPNSTDFTVFKNEGIAGLNFAYIDEFTTYHSSLDTFENASEPSLQHHGTYALALARALGNQDLTNPRGTDAVYFNLLGPVLVHYSSALVLPLLALLVLLWLTVIVLGFRRRFLTFGGLIISVFAFLVPLILATVIVTLTAPLLGASHSEFAVYGPTYNGQVYLLGFVVLTIAVTTTFYLVFNTKINLANLSGGALVWWLVLAVLTSVALPGGSYLFVWPLFSTMIGVGTVFAQHNSARAPRWSIAVLLLCAIPGIIIWTPVASLLFVALSMRLAAVATTAVVLLLGLLIPYLRLITRVRIQLLPCIAAVVGIGCLVFASVTNTIDRQHPRLNNVFYGLNANTGTAIWGTTNLQLDDWSRQFFNARVQQRPLDDYFPFTSQPYTTGSAPTLVLAAPRVTLISDTTQNTSRTLRLRVASARQAPFLWVYADQDTQLLNAAVNGKPLPLAAKRPVSNTSGPSWGMIYWAPPPQGIELTLTVTSGQPTSIRVIDSTIGLPELLGAAFTPRPDTVVPSPSIGIGGYSNTTMVSKRFTFATTAH